MSAYRTLLLAAVMSAMATGCGARTPLEMSDGEVAETEEEHTTSSAGAGSSRPSQETFDAAATAAWAVEHNDQDVIDACCRAGCRPYVLDVGLVDCGLECIANPEACTSDQECLRSGGSDLCGVFPDHFVTGRCVDR